MPLHTSVPQVLALGLLSPQEPGVVVEFVFVVLVDPHVQHVAFSRQDASAI